MNTPNPLVPQGSLQQNLSKGKSTVRIAVFTIIAIHGVFFTGLLMQSGCKRDTDRAAGQRTEPTNNPANELPKLDQAYYSNIQEVPAVATNLPATNELVGQPANVPTPVVVTPSAPPPARETPAETTEYTIVRGDNLTKIAKANNVRIADITKANPGLDAATLRPGQKIQVPLTASLAPGIGLAEPASSETGNGTVHVVKAGENLTKIAKQHGTTPKAIRTENKLKTDRLLVGQKLKVPAASAPATPAKTGASTSASPISVSSRDLIAPRASGSTATNLR